MSSKLSMVFASIANLRSPVARFGDFLYGDSSKSIVPFIPRPIRYLLFLLLLINGHSFPFVWHLRYFLPILRLRLRWWSLKFSSARTKDRWLDSFQPIGLSPFSVSKTYWSYASLDESDFNMHLSNSSYAKTLDAVRLHCGIQIFLAFAREGGWIGLAGTHFNFIREIPILSQYEVRSFIGSWDGKWLYLVSLFVSKSKRAAAAKRKVQRHILDAQPKVQDYDDPSSKSQVPVISFDAPSAVSGSPSVSGSVTPAINAGLDRLTNVADDETLHCVAISQICFKIGRITVPPALVLASNGFGLSEGKWAELKQMRKKSSSANRTGSKLTGLSMLELLKGAWKDIPAENRWWDHALASDEEERVRRLDVLNKIKDGMEGARAL